MALIGKIPVRAFLCPRIPIPTLTTSEGGLYPIKNYRNDFKIMRCDMRKKREPVSSPAPQGGIMAPRHGRTGAGQGT
jgi:hypothetical protein